MGLYFDRSAGNKVNLRIVEKKFRLYFVDNENKILPPEYDSALVHAENVIRKSGKGDSSYGFPVTDSTSQVHEFCFPD